MPDHHDRESYQTILIDLLNIYQTDYNYLGFVKGNLRTNFHDFMSIKFDEYLLVEEWVGRADNFAWLIRRKEIGLWWKRIQKKKITLQKGNKRRRHTLPVSFLIHEFKIITNFIKTYQVRPCYCMQWNYVLVFPAILLTNVYRSSKLNVHLLFTKSMSKFPRDQFFAPTLTSNALYTAIRLTIELFMSTSINLELFFEKSWNSLVLWWKKPCMNDCLIKHGICQTCESYLQTQSKLVEIWLL